MTITVVDDVPANPMEGEFLKRAFAARALKTAKMTKRK